MGAKAERDKNLELEGAQSTEIAFCLQPGHPRTSPDAYNGVLMALARWQVAASPRSMRAGGGAHRHQLASRLVAACCVSPAADHHQSQSIVFTKALDHTNTCAHVTLELKFG